MNVLTPSELDAAACALLVLPEEVWDAVARHLIETTLLAAMVSRTLNRSHPALGNGTLYATLRGWPVEARPTEGPVRYARALQAVTGAVIRACSSDSAAKSDQS